MKKNFFSLLLAAGIAVAATPAHAKVWNVANTFSTAQAAHDAPAVLSGDTLYFAGSGTSYGPITLTKKLALFGPGYFLTENPQTQANTQTAVLDYVSFDTGSAGSEMQGMSTTGVVYASTNNIKVSRNYCIVPSNFCIQIADGSSGVTISQNYLTEPGSTGGSGIKIGTSCTGILITNNIIDTFYAPISSSTTGAGVTIAQNVFKSLTSTGLTTNSAIVYNNIFATGGAVTGSGNTFSNNICSGTQIAAGNGNQQNVTMTTVFTGTGSTDGKWALKAGSPAIGAGLGGYDCGIFGGTTPYVLSGQPPIPHIWFYAQPGTVPAGGTIQVQIKAKSQN